MNNRETRTTYNTVLKELEAKLNDADAAKRRAEKTNELERQLEERSQKVVQLAAEQRDPMWQHVLTILRFISKESFNSPLFRNGTRIFDPKITTEERVIFICEFLQDSEKELNLLREFERKRFGIEPDSWLSIISQLTNSKLNTLINAKLYSIHSTQNIDLQQLAEYITQHPEKIAEAMQMELHESMHSYISRERTRMTM